MKNTILLVIMVGLLSQTVLASEPYRLRIAGACSENKSLEWAESLLKNKADLNAKDSEGMTILLTAATINNWTYCGTDPSFVSALKLLIKHGAKTEITDQNGNTALHYAARTDNAVVTQVLLENGADPNAQNQEGLSPLTLALDPHGYSANEPLIEENAARVLKRFHAQVLRTLHYRGDGVIASCFSGKTKENVTLDFHNRSYSSSELKLEKPGQSLVFKTVLSGQKNAWGLPAAKTELAFVNAKGEQAKISIHDSLNKTELKYYAVGDAYRSAPKGSGEAFQYGDCVVFYALTTDHLSWEPDYRSELGVGVPVLVNFRTKKATVLGGFRDYGVNGFASAKFQNSSIRITRATCPDASLDPERTEVVIHREGVQTRSNAKEAH